MKFILIKIGLCGMLASCAELKLSTIESSEVFLLSVHSISGSVPIKSWKTLRDDRIIKQDLDYSCGAASLATVLNSYYGKNVTEEQLLHAMDKGELRASFEDMARALQQFGFKAQGFAADWEQLALLRMPVILYVQNRKTDHFTVLRGINADTVLLADPSLGNRTYSKEQFLRMWQTRQGDVDNAHLRGKFLAVLPREGNVVARGSDFFTKTPNRQSAASVEQLNIRFWQ